MRMLERMVVQVRSAPTVQVMVHARSGAVYLTLPSTLLVFIVLDAHLTHEEEEADR